MTNDTSTICAYSGGALPAAIGIIRLSGPSTGAILGELFHPGGHNSIADCISNKLYYGTLLAQDGKSIDRCLACLYRAPHSYTGEDMGEIFCHGSRAVVDETLRHAFAHGARPAEAGEFTQRAFLAGKMDLVQSEAVADLIDAPSPLAAKAAAAQLGGSVGGEITALRARASALLAHFYAVCDYTDEDIDPFEAGHAAGELHGIAERLERLRDGFERGRIVREGLPVALIGRPNAGKSTLFNALAGFDRAIVTSEAGTTRDLIEHTVSLGDASVRLMDTAGIREPEGQAEALGIERTVHAAHSAQVVLCVVDAAAGINELDERAVALAEQCAQWAVVVNKSDAANELQLAAASEWARARAPLVFTLSAMQNLTHPLEDWLRSLIPEPDELFVTSARQAALLTSAAADFRAAAHSCSDGMTADAFLSDAERGISTLGQITGETASADIAAEIFSRFCVGK